MGNNVRDERSTNSPTPSASRRTFLGAAVTATATSGALLVPNVARADAPAPSSSATSAGLAAKPPTGFAPYSAPGKIVKISKTNTLQPNGLYPTPAAARDMLTKAMTELTGEKTLPLALQRFVHPADQVAVKVNGIAKGQKFGSNRELVDVLLQGLIEAGIPATSIVVYEQYNSFLAGTRISSATVPAGVRTMVHSNKDMLTPKLPIQDGRATIYTQFARPLMEATAVINVSLIKDHAICGYTGCLKNMTHGSIANPQDFHAHNASPQIAKLYAHEAIKSRVRLHIADGYKLMYDGGPVEVVSFIPHEAVYVSTDPVALDAFGWETVDKVRADKGMKSLADVGRKPSYILAAGDLGLGIADRSKIRVREIAI